MTDLNDLLADLDNLAVESRAAKATKTAVRSSIAPPKSALKKSLADELPTQRTRSGTNDLLADLESNVLLLPGLDAGGEGGAAVVLDPGPEPLVAHAVRPGDDDTPATTSTTGAMGSSPAGAAATPPAVVDSNYGRDLSEGVRSAANPLDQLLSNMNWAAPVITPAGNRIGDIAVDDPNVQVASQELAENLMLYQTRLQNPFRIRYDVENRSTEDAEVTVDCSAAQNMRFSKYRGSLSDMVINVSVGGMQRIVVCELEAVDERKTALVNAQVSAVFEPEPQRAPLPTVAATAPREEVQALTADGLVTIKCRSNGELPELFEYEVTNTRPGPVGILLDFSNSTNAEMVVFPKGSRDMKAVMKVASGHAIHFVTIRQADINRECSVSYEARIVTPGS